MRDDMPEVFRIFLFLMFALFALFYFGTLALGEWIVGRVKR